jgi:hypothetical protein
MSDFNYNITKKLGVLSQTESREYTKEVNLISYNGREPIVDIRRWDRKSDKMQKGITLNHEEVQALKDILATL